MFFSGIVLLSTALILGLRHGIDWDHIAAITDITGSQENKTASFSNAMSYALGHGAVIIGLGLLAVILGVHLPDWVDMVMEPVVGITLVILGAWLLSSILYRKQEFKLVSKWGLVIQAVRQLKHKLSHHHSHAALPTQDQIGFKSSFGVGMIHGIGAETPTQLLIFAAAAGAANIFLGSMFVLSFVLGLLISNTAIALVAISGFTGIQKNPRIALGVGFLSGVFSIGLGILFLTGNGAVLPAILAG